MPEIINSTLINKLRPNSKQYEIRDSKLTGFLIRVNPSGTMTYVCEFGRGRRVNIGKVGLFTPSQARDKAQEILGNAVRGIYPGSNRSSKHLTFHSFLTEHYEPWRLAHRKGAVAEIKRLKRHFLKELGENKLLNAITPFIVEKWQTKRLSSGIKAPTVVRDIACLKTALSKAVEWELLASNPLSKLESPKLDAISRIRYLSDDEELRLKKALDDREEELRSERDKANNWRRKRGYKEFPNLRQRYFADYLKPMVIIARHTGIRKSELLGLQKEKDINLNLAILSVTDVNAKNNKTRHIPLNKEALVALKKWFKQTGDSGLLFANKNGEKFVDIKKSWQGILKRAGLEGFHWHDLRHDFASRLVMKGVDLNTVRELLGHADIKMTLRYAHLAHGHKANAVAKLVEK